MTTWNEVQANPEYQKLSPQDKEAARSQYFNDVVAPRVPKEQLTVARQEFDKDTMKAAPAEQQKKAKGLFGDPNPMPSPMTEAISEPFMKAVTGVGGAALGGLRMIGGVLAGDPKAVEKGQAVAQKHTYEPKSETGQAVSSALAVPGTKLAEGADVVGRNVAEVTHSPLLGAAANAGTQVAAQALLGKGAGLAGEAAGIGSKAAGAAATSTRAAARAAPTLELAKDYAATKLGSKWEDLPEGVQKKLKTAARDPAELNKLDAESVRVEARAERLKYPVTRGQVERDPAQLGSENRMSKTPGNPVSAIKAAQDEALHTAVDKVRESTGATAQTREGVGKSVQNEALRPKVAESMRNYNRLYKQARATEPDAAVPPHSLYELLDKNPEIQHLGFMESWLRKAKVKTKGPGEGIDLGTDISKAKKAAAGEAKDEIQIRNVKLSELEDLRKKAAGIAKKGGDNAYYAGEVVKAIDDAFEKIPTAAKAWKAARDAFKAHKLEFEDQSIVKDLATDKSRTDRRTGLSATADKIMGYEAEDISKLKKSLLEGGTEKTRQAGEKAWKNVQAGVIDYLREKAHGRRANVNENRTDEFNGAFRDAFAELDKDGKIDVIFDKPQAAKLREVYQAVGDVRTEPSSRIHGSDTAANQSAQKIENTLSGLEKASKLPWVGKPFAGTVGAARAVWDMGSTTRAHARAKTTPLTEAAETAKGTRAKADKKRRTAAHTLKTIKRGTRTSRLTLQDQSQNDSQ
jgi:hypothetical protein